MKKIKMAKIVFVFVSVFLLLASLSSIAQTVSAGECLTSSDEDCVQNLINSLAKSGGSFDSPGGGEIYFPPGRYFIKKTLKMQKDVYLRGAGIDATVISFIEGTYSNNTAIDGRGNSTSDTLIFGISNMTIDGVHAMTLAPFDTAIDGIQLAYNNRSTQLLNKVKLQQFGRHGIHFVGENWNLTFEDNEIAQNGRKATNASGVYSDQGIPNLIAINFKGGFIEDNGSSSSAAGGVFLNSSPTMRGITFKDMTIEENLGTDQVLVINAASVVFDNIYSETAVQYSNEACVAIELVQSVGVVTNSTFAAGSLSACNNKKVAIKKSASPNITVINTYFLNAWNVKY